MNEPSQFHPSPWRLLGAGLVLTLVVGVSLWRGLSQPQLGESVGLIALATALLAALWSTLGARCQICGLVSRLTGGLRLDALGAGFYTCMWILWAIRPGHPAVLVGLSSAVGIHAMLVGLLLQHRLACPPCLIAAGAALVAAAAALVSNPVSIPVGLGLIALGGVSFGASKTALRFSRQVVEWRRRAASLELIRDTIAGAEEVPPGMARIVVYKRHGCRLCTIFDTTLQPELETTFGKCLTIESRQLHGPGAATPLVIVLGGALPLAIDVAEQADALEALRGAIESVLDDRPARGKLNFIWVGG